jgi:hypothetical protein
MSCVIAAPDMMAAAATDVAAVGSTLGAAHVAAAAPTVAVIPAAADEVSASIAHLFSRHAQDYQGLAGQAAAFHEQYVQHLNASARSYAIAEGANVASLQPLNATSGASANAIAALIGPAAQIALPNPLGPYVTFAFDLAIFLQDLALVPINFFVFLINSGVPLSLFGVVIFPGF